VGQKRRAEELAQVGEGPSDRRHKRARALDSQGSGVELTPVRDQEATLKASNLQNVSQGMELEEGLLKLQEHPGSTPCRFRRPEWPLPGEEAEWDTTEESSSVVSEEGTVEKGEVTGASKDESVSCESSTGDGGESTDDAEESSGKTESTGDGAESTDDGDESAVTQGQGKYCHACDKRFSRPSDLKRHLDFSQAHGGGSQGRVCAHCGVIMARGDGLERHLKICPAIRAARNGKAFDRTAKRRGRPTLRGMVDIQDGRSTAGQVSASGSRTTKAAPTSQRTTQPPVGGRKNPTRQCKRV